MPVRLDARNTCQLATSVRTVHCIPVCLYLSELTYKRTSSMVKKGLSLEEKRAKVLAIFHEADEVFQLKEIEKLASKQGVVLQSVKEVVQSLVDDDMVHQDKIGIGNFLWAFAAEASTKVRNDQAKLEAALTSAQVRLDADAFRHVPCRCVFVSVQNKFRKVAWCASGLVRK